MSQKTTTTHISDKPIEPIPPDLRYYYSYSIMANIIHSPEYLARWEPPQKQEGKKKDG